MFVFKQVTTNSSALILIALLVVISPAASRADDLTGLPMDDPKDLRPSPPSSYSAPTGSCLFLPMPRWSRGVVMPPLPDQLMPMGGKTAIAITTNKTPPLAPPKDEVTTVTTTASSSNGTTTSTKAATDNSNQAMIAVSPFLQWIKSNPQVAAEQARQQAESYRTPAMSSANPPSEPGAGNSGTQGADANPYWLPPLIDSSDFGPQPAGGSAAIYEKPQR